MDPTPAVVADLPVFARRIRARDGAVLSANVYEPVNPVRGNVIINSATATPQGYYRHFARWLAGSGYRTLTYDYRGVGDSRTDRAAVQQATMADWACQDFAGVLLDTQTRYADEPMFCIGHSFGGQALGMVPEARRLDAAVIVASQSGYWGNWPTPFNLYVALLWYAMVPTMSAVFNGLPKWAIGHRVPRGVADEWARWGRHPDHFAGAVPAARKALAEFDRPVLAYSFADDKFYAPRRSVDVLVGKLATGRGIRRHLSPQSVGAEKIGHFGFFRPQFRSTLWPEIPAFLQKCLSGEVPRLETSSEPEPLTIDDVLHDLEYGREDR